MDSNLESSEYLMSDDPGGDARIFNTFVQAQNHVQSDGEATDVEEGFSHDKRCGGVFTGLPTDGEEGSSSGKRCDGVFMGLPTDAGGGSSSGSPFFSPVNQTASDGGDNEGDAGDRKHYVISTPNGTQFWIPNVSPRFIPEHGESFTTFEDALAMYKAYADHAGFCVKKGQTKVWMGIATHKYLL